MGVISQLSGSISWKVDKLMLITPLAFKVHTIYLLHRKNFFRPEISAKKILWSAKNSKKMHFYFETLVKLQALEHGRKKNCWPLQICSRLAKKIFMFIRQNAEKIWDGLGGIRTENPHFSLNSLCSRKFVRRKIKLETVKK